MARLRQEDFLYGLEWDSIVDTTFAEALSDQALNENFHAPGGDNTDVIETVQLVVNMSFKKNFSFKECWHQAHKLRKRYRIFSWLLSVPGVTYDASLNRIQCEANLWRTIVGENAFAHAYVVYGDPCWPELKVLFGEPPARPTQSFQMVEIIDIPSDEEDQLAIVKPTVTEVIDLESNSISSHDTSYRNKVVAWRDDTDSTDYGSVNTEPSSSNPSASRDKKKGKNAFSDAFWSRFKK